MRGAKGPGISSFCGSTWSVLLVVFVISSLHPGSAYSGMDCGEGVDLCGILTLESGLGPNFYRHKNPSVHGLWPQVKQYGSSKCIIPQDSAPPVKIYPCYMEGAKDTGIAHQLEFETHEWEKHGMCSGTKSADDYFNQVCSLAKKPLDAMKHSGGKMRDFQKMITYLKLEGLPVYGVDEKNQQIMLSACFVPKRKMWILSPVNQFHLYCSNTDTYE